MVSDGNVLVVGEQRLVGTEEEACAGGMVDGGVEIGVVGNVDGPEEFCSGDGVEGGSGLILIRCGDFEKCCEDAAKFGPGGWAEG